MFSAPGMERWCYSEAPASRLAGAGRQVTKCSPERPDRPGCIADHLLAAHAVMSFLAGCRLPPQPLAETSRRGADLPTRPSGLSEFPPLGNLGAAQLALGPVKLGLHGSPSDWVHRLLAHSAQCSLHTRKGALRTFPLHDRIPHNSQDARIILQPHPARYKISGPA